MQDWMTPPWPKIWCCCIFNSSSILLKLKHPSYCASALLLLDGKIHQIWNVLVCNLIYVVPRQVVSWHFPSCCDQGPNGLQSSIWSTLIDSSLPFFTPVSKKVPLWDCLKLIHLHLAASSLSLYRWTTACSCRQWSSERNALHLKIIAISQDCTDYAPRHVKDRHCLSPIRVLSH